MVRQQLLSVETYIHLSRNPTRKKIFSLLALAENTRGGPGFSYMPIFKPIAIARRCDGLYLVYVEHERKKIQNQLHSILML